MKIAVPADEPSLEARVQNKLGTTPYLLVVDPDDMSFQQNSRWGEALRKTAKQYRTLIPVLTGVILLTGLFKAFIPKELLLTMFSGSMIQDTFAGASSAVCCQETRSIVT
jgi:uncharacterized membrane protein YraQ (UPF0718 family)